MTENDVKENDVNLENNIEPKENPSKKKICKKVLAILQILLVIVCIFFLITLITKPEVFLPNILPKNSSSIPSNLKISTDALESGQAKDNQAMTYFIGYDDQYVSKSESISLGNDISNKEDNLYIEFTILDENGQEIYKSDLIAPGMEIQWVPGEYLEIGTYNLIFHEQPYKILNENKELNESNLQALYYINQNVSVTITE